MKHIFMNDINEGAGVRGGVVETKAESTLAWRQRVAEIEPRGWFRPRKEGSWVGRTTGLLMDVENRNIAIGAPLVWVPLFTRS